jgi:hypothetical protein
MIKLFLNHVIRKRDYEKVLVIQVEKQVTKNTLVSMASRRGEKIFAYKVMAGRSRRKRLVRRNQNRKDKGVMK